MMRLFHIAAATALCLAFSYAAPSWAQTVMNEHKVQISIDKNIQIYARERLLEGKTPGEIDKAFLFVHGATYPGITFDMDLEDGTSWMDHTAEAGYATYYLDIRGYGYSTRPEIMEQPPEENKPFARAEKDAEVIKAPNGVLVDLWEVFNARPIYDASKITVPTLLIRGNADPTSTDADSQGLFNALSSDIKRYVVIAHGTHFINLEKHAPQLFAETLLFLNEGSE